MLACGRPIIIQFETGRRTGHPAALWPGGRPAPGNLPSEKVNPGSNLRPQKINLFSIEKRARTECGPVPLVAIELLPYCFVLETEYLNAYLSRLLEDRRISILDEQKTSQDAVSVKLKVSPDEETLLRQAAAAQRTVDGQKRVRVRHGHFSYRLEGSSTWAPAR
jgi:hypothetical protein